MKNLKGLVMSVALAATSVAFAGQEIGGTQMSLKDSTVGVSGLWNWIMTSDTLGIGTEVVPANGTSPLYAKEDGSIFAEAYMKIGPEPEWTQEKADAGLLKYPVANIQVHFKSDECVKDSSCGVDFAKLGIKYIRVTQKSSGPMRMAILNTLTDEIKKNFKDYDEAEPGIELDNTNDYTTVTYDMTPYDYGFKGLGKGKEIDILNWVDYSTAPEGTEILKSITGLKWSVRDPHGGTGEISIKSIEFLDASKGVIKTSLLTGVVGTRSNINDPLYTEIANGKQQTLKDTTVGVSGLWNWIASHDFLDIGTVMVPASGTSPLFAKEDGSIFAEASMKIGPEPEWTQELADAGLLKYPEAYIEMKFKKDDCVEDSSCGVNFAELGVKYLRIRAKSSGPMRMTVLNEKTAEPGAEPGVYIPNSSGYQTTTYDMTPYDFGFKGFDDKNSGGIFDWVDMSTAPEGSEILKCITGLRWEVRDPRGASGEISIMSVEFLDKDKNVIDAVKLTGMEGVQSVIDLTSSSSEEPASSSSEEVESSSSEEIASSSSEEPESSSSEEPKSSSSKTTKSSSSVAPKSSSSSKAKSSSSVAPKSSSSKKAKSSSSSAPKSSSSSKKKDALPLQHAASTIHVAVSGMQLMISNATLGSDYAVFTMQGKVITVGKIQRGTESVTLQNQGAYLVRVGHEVFKVNRL